MVSKTSKSKEKKAQRKEMLAKLSAAQQLLNAANNPTNNHLESLVVFQKYNRNGLDLKISCHHYNNIDKETFTNMYNLLEANMKQEYEACNWGWNEKDKRNEMMDKDPWFLIARDQEDKIAGFAHFKFDFDEEIEVIYCYEVQVTEDMRGKGLGKFLMQIMELVGARSNMKKIMVTVFKHSPRPHHFFTDIMKYTDDDTSPRFVDPDEEEDYCYEILSKLLPQKKVPASGS